MNGKTIKKVAKASNLFSFIGILISMTLANAWNISLGEFTMLQLLWIYLWGMLYGFILLGMFLGVVVVIILIVIIIRDA